MPNTIEEIKRSPSERRSPLAWHVITNEYPPQVGGVSDYTELLAGALAAKGHEVHVWCPSCPGAQNPRTGGAIVHREMGSITPADLGRLSRLLDHFPAPRRLLVQWVPHGYGYRSMNLAFCRWVWQRAHRYGDHVDLMVHEPSLPFRALAWRQNAVALVHRVMTIVLLRAACRVWMSIPGWEPRLRPLTLGRAVPFQWLPIFSNVPVVDDAPRVQEIRCRYAPRDEVLIGHFGTYGTAIAALLRRVLLALAAEPSGFAVVLMGHRSVQFRRELIQREPRLAGLVHATGQLPAEQISLHLAACDLMIQPYPDGVSTRRTSFMAGLSHGKPVVTTRGELTEPLWTNTDAAAIVSAQDNEAFVAWIRRLIADAAERHRIGSAARRLYQERFDISHVVNALEEAAMCEDLACVS